MVEVSLCRFSQTHQDSESVLLSAGPCLVPVERGLLDPSGRDRTTDEPVLLPLTFLLYWQRSQGARYTWFESKSFKKPHSVYSY
jgi:hypothetical protein